MSIITDRVKNTLKYDFEDWCALAYINFAISYVPTES